jgi:hypothetical protein
LFLTASEELKLVKVDRLLTGAAVAVPTAKQGLQ